jgi:hypothetical protein
VGQLKVFQYLFPGQVDPFAFHTKLITDFHRILLSVNYLCTEEIYTLLTTLGGDCSDVLEYTFNIGLSA